MHGHFGPTLGIAWLKLCHSAWGVLIADLRQHGPSVLWRWLFIFLRSIGHLWCSSWQFLAGFSSWFGWSLPRNPNWRPSSSMTWLNLCLARFPWNIYLVETLWTMISGLFLGHLLIFQNTLSQKHFRILSFRRWLIVQYLIFGRRPQFTIALIVELWIGRVSMLL